MLLNIWIKIVHLFDIIKVLKAPSILDTVSKILWENILWNNIFETGKELELKIINNSTEINIKKQKSKEDMKDKNSTKRKTKTCSKSSRTRMMLLQVRNFVVKQ